MGSYRKDRINDAVANELTEILRKVKDPRISNAFLSVSGARVAGDLSQARTDSSPPPAISGANSRTG